MTLIIILVISILISKVTTIFTTIAFFSMISVGLIKSSTMAYLLESFVKVIIYFLILYFSLRFISKYHKKAKYIFLISYIIFTTLVQLILHLISTLINNSPFQLGMVFPEIELIVSGLFFIYFYYIKKS